MLLHSLSRSCSKFVVFLFIFMCFICLFFFVPVLSSVYCSFLKSVLLLLHSLSAIIQVSTANATYCLSLLKIVPFWLVFIFLINFVITILNSVVDLHHLFSSLFPCQMLRTFELGVLFFRLNLAMSFLVISLISLVPLILLKFRINRFRLLSHSPA